MNLKETIRAVEEVEDIALTDDNFTQEHLTAIEIALSALKCQRRGFWIWQHHDVFECSECKQQVFGTPDFCEGCGSRNERKCDEE